MKLKDIFEMDDRFTPLVVNLAIIRNDIKNSLKYITDSLSNEVEMDSSRQIYHQRIVVVHFREAMKYIVKKRDLIYRIIDEPEDEATSGYRAKLEEVINFCEPFDSSKLKLLYKPMRDATIHYEKNDKAILKVLESIKPDYELKLTRNGDMWFDIDYDFAGDFALNLTYQHIIDLDSKAIMNITADVIQKTMELVDVSDYVIQKFISLKSS